MMKNITQSKKAIKWIVYSLLIFFTFIFQTTFGASMRVRSVIPDMLLSLVLCVAMFEGIGGGIAAALSAGVLIDFCASYFVGFNMLFLTLICVVIGYVSKEFLKQNMANAVIFGFAAAFIYNAIFFFFHVVVFNAPKTSASGWFAVLAEAVLTTACIPLSYAAVKFIYVRALKENEEFE